MNIFSSKHAIALVAALGSSIPLAAGCRGIIGVEERELTDELSCDTYCETIQKACKGDRVQYASSDACLKMCATFDKGAKDDANVDTLGCRLRVAESIASTGEDTDCPGAGPAGDGSCGTSCEGYCRSLEALCPTEFLTFEGKCVEGCGEIPDCGGYVAAADRDDDSIQCRMFHLTSAAVDATTHCPHSIANGHCEETTLACPTTN